MLQLDQQGYSNQKKELQDKFYKKENKVDFRFF